MALLCAFRPVRPVGDIAALPMPDPLAADVVGLPKFIKSDCSDGVRPAPVDWLGAALVPMRGDPMVP